MHECNKVCFFQLHSYNQLFIFTISLMTYIKFIAMKVFKTGVLLLFFSGVLFSGCAVKTCPAYAKKPAKFPVEKSVKAEKEV